MGEKDETVRWRLGRMETAVFGPQPTSIPGEIVRRTAGALIAAEIDRLARLALTDAEEAEDE